MKRPGIELTLEVGQTSRGFLKKYEAELKFKIVESFWLAMASDVAGSALVIAHGKDPYLGESLRFHGIRELRPKRSTYRARFRVEVVAHRNREQLSSR